MSSSSKTSLEEMLSGQERLRESKMSRFKKKMSQDPNYINTATNIVYKKIIDDITMELIGEYYRAHKLGYSEYLYLPLEGSNDGSLKTASEVENEKKSEGIKCPNCSCPTGALRFVMHLESCMGLGGRSSSRVASKRIVNSNRGNMYGNIPTDDEEDEWNISNERPSKPSKKSDSSKRNKKHTKQKNSTPTKASQSSAKESSSSLSKMKNLPVEERLAFLSTNCGAKLDSTTLCSKPLKCKSHTDNERTITRKLLSASLLDNVVTGNFINIQDLDLPMLDNEMENGVSLSPADSNSSLSSSSSSYKRKSK